MSIQLKNIIFVALVFACLHQSAICLKQIQLILKFEDAINLQTNSFLLPHCESEVKISQTLSQLDEWVRITQSKDSLKQYKQSLIDLADTIQQSQRYVEQKEIQTSLEKATESVSEIQLNTQNTNIDLTLDELTEKLSRIENIQTYLDTLQEEGFQDYNDYEKVINSLKSFIQDIDNLENLEDELGQNRFKLIQKADEVQQIYNKCYPQTEEIFQEQDLGSTVFVDKLGNQVKQDEKNSTVSRKEQDNIAVDSYSMDLNLNEELDSNTDTEVIKVLDQQDIQMLQEEVQEEALQEKEEVAEQLEVIEDIAVSISQNQEQQQEEKVLLQAQITSPHLRQLKKAKYF